MSQAFAHIVDDDEAIRDALTWLFRTRQVASQPWESYQVAHSHGGGEVAGRAGERLCGR